MATNQPCRSVWQRVRHWPGPTPSARFRPALFLAWLLVRPGRLRAFVTLERLERRWHHQHVAMLATEEADRLDRLRNPAAYRWQERKTPPVRAGLVGEAGRLFLRLRPCRRIKLRVPKVKRGFRFACKVVAAANGLRVTIDEGLVKSFRQRPWVGQ